MNEKDKKEVKKKMEEMYQIGFCDGREARFSFSKSTPNIRFNLGKKFTEDRIRAKLRLMLSKWKNLGQKISCEKIEKDLVENFQINKLVQQKKNEKL